MFTRDLSTLTGAEFEELVDRLLRAMGFRILSRSTGMDGGIDIIAEMKTELLTNRYAIQCKCYTGKVGVSFVRELYGVVISERLDKGVLITNSDFTNQALEFARGKQLELINGERLHQLAARYLRETSDEVVEKDCAHQLSAKRANIQRELLTLRDFLFQQRRLLDKSLIPRRVQPLQSLDAAAKFLGVQVTSMFTTVSTIWNLLTELREGFNRAAEGLPVAEDELCLLIDNLKASVNILNELHVEAYGRLPVWPAQGGGGGESLGAVFKNLRALYSAIYENVGESIQEMLDFLDRDGSSMQLKLPEGIGVEDFPASLRPISS